MSSGPLLDAWIVPTLLARVGRPVVDVDVHAFAYLAQIAAVLENPDRSVGDYAYFATAQGSPFAPDLENALERLRRRGALSADEDGRLRPEEDIPEWLFDNQLAADRVRYLYAATDAALHFHVGQVRRALRQSPGLRTALSAPTAARELLAGAHAAVLRQQAHSLNEALEDQGSLSSRVALYIVALLRHASDEREQSRVHVS